MFKDYLMKTAIFFTPACSLIERIEVNKKTVVQTDQLYKMQKKIV